MKSFFSISLVSICMSEHWFSPRIVNIARLDWVWHVSLKLLYISPPPGPWGSTVTRNLIGLPSQCLQSKPQNIRYDSHEDKVAQHVEMITLVLTKKKSIQTWSFDSFFLQFSLLITFNFFKFLFIRGQFYNVHLSLHSCHCPSISTLCFCESPTKTNNKQTQKIKK